MDDRAAITETTVQSLAEAADLPLSAERRLALTPQLEVWITLANELSRTMSAAEHSTITPITVFSHGALGGNR